MKCQMLSVKSDILVQLKNANGSNDYTNVIAAATEIIAMMSDVTIVLRDVVHLRVETESF